MPDFGVRSWRTTTFATRCPVFASSNARTSTVGGVIEVMPCGAGRVLSPLALVRSLGFG
jgi:hypothetical protein